MTLQHRQRSALLVLAAAALLASVCDGFTTVQWRLSRPLSSITVEESKPLMSNTRLQMAEDDKNEEVKEEETAASAEEGEEEVTESEDTEDEEEEEEEEKEDPELKALKEEIAKLESEIKSKRSTLQYYEDLADDFTKTGYARKVAEMENMRRARSMLASSNKFSATAGILAQFLPILDELDALKVKYADNEFGQQYSALPGAMRTAFTKLGMEEFQIAVGDAVDKSRMSVVESKHSAEYEKDTVLEVLSPGFELKGNTIRMAECVASLGKEEEPAAESESEGNEEATEEE